MATIQRVARRRSEVPAGSQTARPANTGSHLARGAMARQKAKQASEQRSGDRNQPWRFWLRNDDKIDENSISDMYPDGIPNNEAEIIILDETLDDVVGMYEHNLKIGGWFRHFEACPKEWDNCPLCERGEKSYYVVLLSVLVLRPWVSKDGKKSGDWTRMLLPVKSAQLAKFDELCQASQKKNGKLRGTSFVMKRDTSNPKCPSIGEPSVLEGGVMFEFYDEDYLVGEFGHDAVKSPEGKVLKPENEDITPFPYEEIFTKPVAADLRKRYGAGAQAGSQDDVEEEWSEPSARRVTSRRKPAQAEAVVDDDPLGEDELPE
jgi:hypothetical protein